MHVCQVSSSSTLSTGLGTAAATLILICGGSAENSDIIEPPAAQNNEARVEPPSRHPREPSGGGSQKRLNIHFSLLFDVFHIYLDARERFVTGRHNSNS